LEYRVRITPLERERIRHLGRIAANLNMIAKWANTHKRHAEAAPILAQLVSIERAVIRHGRGQ
jgi:hypothetical protein